MHTSRCHSLVRLTLNNPHQAYSQPQFTHVLVLRLSMVHPASHLTLVHTHGYHNLTLLNPSPDLAHTFAEEYFFFD